MSDFGGNYLTGPGGSTWVDEYGGIIPRGTNATPSEAHAAQVTLAEHALTADDPQPVLGQVAGDVRPRRRCGVSFYTVRPISDRTPFTGEHEHSDFKASWNSTLSLLRRELEHLGATDVVIEVDAPESAIRLDGMLYANAKVVSPAVRVAFSSQVGPLVYATDRYVSRGYRTAMAGDWQHNVRAIALGLEALRKVDRYGITQRHQQYAGFKALPAGTNGTGTHMTRTEALGLVFMLAGLNVEPTHFEDPINRRRALRAARATAHPDRHDGDRTLWDQVEQAAQVLGLVAP